MEQKYWIVATSRDNVSYYRSIPDKCVFGGGRRADQLNGELAWTGPLAGCRAIFTKEQATDEIKRCVTLNLFGGSRNFIMEPVS